MLVPTNYAVVSFVPHFEVKVWNRRDRAWDVTNQRLYLSREECRPMFEWLTVQDSDTYEIIEYPVVFHCRCVICGDPPDDEVYLFSEWDELVAYIAECPGWVTTSELNVLCPDHRPLREE